MPSSSNKRPLTFRPIGVVRSPFKETAGMPIQGFFAPDSVGTVEVFDEFAPGLADLDGFSHLYLIYVFHRREGERLTCVPFLDKEPRGVFATRAPCRPNPIGLSIVRLLKIEGGTLHIGELDILDGTPLLDIKPYVPTFDARVDATTGWLKRGLQKPAAPTADDRFSG